MAQGSENLEHAIWMCKLSKRAPVPMNWLKTLWPSCISGHGGVDQVPWACSVTWGGVSGTGGAMFSATYWNSNWTWEIIIIHREANDGNIWGIVKWWLNITKNIPSLLSEWICFPSSTGLVRTVQHGSPDAAQITNVQAFTIIWEFGWLLGGRYVPEEAWSGWWAEAPGSWWTTLSVGARLAKWIIIEKTISLLI